MPVVPVAPSDSNLVDLGDDGSFHIEVEITSQDVEAPPLEKGEGGRYDFPIAKAVAIGGTATLAALAMALVASVPAMAGGCRGRVVETNSHVFCLRSTDGDEPRVDVMGTQVSMVRLNGGMLTMVKPHTRLVPDNPKLDITFSSEVSQKEIAKADESIRAIENNAAARQHLRIK